MTETAEYIAAIEQDFRPAARCSNKKCLAVFGYEIEKGAYLRIGILKVDKLSGLCTLCGEPINWWSSTRHLDKIVDKKKKRSHNRSTSV